MSCVRTDPSVIRKLLWRQTIFHMITISKNVKILNRVLFQAIRNVYNNTTINACQILLEMVSSDDYTVK